MHPSRQEKDASWAKMSHDHESNNNERRKIVSKSPTKPGLKRKQSTEESEWEDKSEYSSRSMTSRKPGDNTSMVVSIKRRRRTTPFILRWLSLLAVVALTRTIWNSVVFTRYWEESSRDIVDFPPRYLGPAFRTPPRRRSRRKRPPPPPATWSPPKTPIYPASTSQILSLQDSSHPLDDHYWKRICGDSDSQNPISSGSRILISGVLTHPVGSELALTLANECGVETIVGLVDHALDTEASLRLAFLLRRLPTTFQIHLQNLPFLEHKINDIFSSLLPTHVIHLEPTSFLPSNFLDGLPTTITLRNSINHLEHLCNAIAKQQARGLEKNVHFIYVTSRDPNDEFLSKAIESIHPMLLQTYQTHYNVHATRLKLPEIYGPFHEGAKWMKDFPQSNPHHSTKTPMMHLSDSLQAILACMTKRSRAGASGSTLSTYIARNSQITRLKDLSKSLHDLDSEEQPHVAINRLRFMLSWSHKDVYPYGDADVHEESTARLVRKALDVTRSHLSLNQTDGIAQLQRRQHNLFPCHSECAKHTTCRKKSAFDSILPITQNLTQDCRFVLYTTDFSRQLNDLPLLQENAGDGNVAWPKHLLCQVAFVSGKSKLVTSLVNDERRHHPRSDLHTASLNGKLRHNQWLLVWTKNDDAESLPEADYMMPKLVPGNFFAGNVTKAFYLEPSHIDRPPPLQVIWALLAKQLDSKKQKARTTRIPRSVGKLVEIPPVPARHVALFAHSYGIPDEVIKASNMDAMAKFILNQKGQGLERFWPRRQLQFYDHVLDMYDDFQLVDTFLLVHNLQSSRARRLRCEWYEEQLFWSDDSDKRNRDLEDLSLAFVLARWRKENRLVHDEGAEGWGDRIVDPSKGDLVDLSLSDTESSPPIQYHVRLHKPMHVRRQYPKAFNQ
jgi:hypothetical protein